MSEVVTNTNGNNNGGGNNDKYRKNSYRTPSQGELLKAVNSEPNIEMSYIGPSYGVTTRDLEDGMYTELVEGLGIQECVGCVIKPAVRVRRDDSIRVLDVNRTECVALFKLPDNGSVGNNIWRNAGRGYRGGLAINITPKAGPNSQFSSNKKFKEALVTFAADSAIRFTGNDGSYDLVIRQHPDNRSIVMVDLDIMRVIQYAVNVPDPNINFSVTSIDMLEDGESAYLTVQKFIDVIGGGRRANNIDIEALRAAIKPRSGNGGGYNKSRRGF